MTKKGEKGTHHKPKPRLAVYGGAAVGALRFGSNSGFKGVDVVTGTGGSRAKVAGAVVAGAAEHPGEAALNAGVPAVLGAAISIGADKLGVNKVLAKAKAPFRI